MHKIMHYFDCDSVYSKKRYQGAEPGRLIRLKFQVHVFLECSETDTRRERRLFIWAMTLFDLLFFLGLCATGSNFIIFTVSSGCKTYRCNSRFHPGLWPIHLLPERFLLEILPSIGLYHHNAIQQSRVIMQLRQTGIH